MKDNAGMTPPPSLLEMRAPTLSHVAEAPELAASLSSAVQASLSNGTRFPHTLLVGPADSGKQSLAATVAAELGVPLVRIAAETIQGPEEVHEFLSEVPEGAVVLVAMLEGQWNISTELCRVVQGLSVRRTPPPPWVNAGEEWKQDAMPASYPSFTIIATTRDKDAEGYACTSWAEMVLYTGRTAETEGKRIDRMLRRVGFVADEDALRLLSEFAVRSQVRTLRLASSIVLWANLRGVRTLDGASAAGAVTDLSKHLVGPERRGKLDVAGLLRRRGKSAPVSDSGGCPEEPTETKASGDGPTPKELLAISLLVVAIVASAMFLAMGAYRLAFGPELPQPVGGAATATPAQGAPPALIAR